MPENNSYDSLIERYKTWIYDVPAPEEFTRLLKLRCTPDEALFLSAFPFMPHTLEQLKDKLHMSADELISKMNPLIRKGFIFEVQGRSGLRYSLNDNNFANFQVPGWLGIDDDLNREYGPPAHRYYINHMSHEMMGHPTKGLRAIPVAETIRDTKQILPYEDILAFIDKEDFFTVSTCDCRHRHNLDPDFEKCGHVTMNCLHFGNLGRYAIKHGMGREISREQTLEILKDAADAGLVHGISNYKTEIDIVCNCCSCCCLFLERVATMPPIIRGHQRSNYTVVHNADTCRLCGLCEKRCPVEAIKIKESGLSSGTISKNPDAKKVLEYDREKCIGCGVCAHKCPTQSRRLQRRSEKDEDIPETRSDAGIRMLKERNRDFSKIF
jgi:Na+-translocating ferredoxin:NAD+ oxidoreductase subunit B